jgi:hypothetical protein
VHQIKKLTIFAFVSIKSYIKTTLFKRALKQKLRNRHRQRMSTSLLAAREVIVLYDASEEVQNKQAEEFFARLKGFDIKVKTVGYAKYRIIPHYCIPQLTRQFICKNNLNLVGIPTRAALDDLLDEEVDLLISLDMEQTPVLQYLAAVSLARFKVGYNHTDNLPWFDFLVGSKTGEMTDYMNQLIHYLSIKHA